MTIGLASEPFTGSSTLLVFDARVLSTVTLSDVPAGIVTSRNFGAGGAAGLGGGAEGGAALACGGVVAEVDGPLVALACGAACCAGGGLAWGCSCASVR